MKNNVSGYTIAGGLVLVVVGIIGRFLTGTTSVTAFIPLFFGVPIAILGWVMKTPDRTRNAILTVIFLAGLGAMGSFNVVADLFAGSASLASLLSRGIMLIVCVGLLAVNGLWFVQARA